MSLLKASDISDLLSNRFEWVGVFSFDPRDHSEWRLQTQVRRVEAQFGFAVLHSVNLQAGYIVRSKASLGCKLQVY